ncbi:hypothetical protein M4D55_24980 [Metabacillus idriensis]|uniref:hypothetical protein n=1 Tax=Metabacillus idriensis TaxID=324768 RepID=UPI001749BC07|nr:hypothetical protein [Metabacillus idriensis]MCM3598995.1 hypothetical protein [Metabacillus idriensis]
MLIQGEYKCQDCNEDFEWYYQVPQHYSEALRAHVLPKNKVAVSPNTRNEDRTPINVSAYCPRYECGFPNTFDVDYKRIAITK